jgi:hypothetical protein
MKIGLLQELCYPNYFELVGMILPKIIHTIVLNRIFAFSNSLK